MASFGEGAPVSFVTGERGHAYIGIRASVSAADLQSVQITEV